eukprot:4668711-Prymnesium_polylepis.1
MRAKRGGMSGASPCRGASPLRLSCGSLTTRKNSRASRGERREPGENAATDRDPDAKSVRYFDRLIRSTVKS